MTETIEQFAARVAQHRDMASGHSGVRASHLIAELPAFLSQHRQVVDGQAMVDAMRDEGVRLKYPDTMSHAEMLAARDRIAAKLTEGARAVPASRPALDVEKVAREIAEMWKEYAGRISLNRAAAAILRRHATDTGWVQCPTTQTAGELVVPEDGKYIVREGVFIHDEWEPLVRGTTLALATAIRRIDTDAPTTWIERTPTTTRAWTEDMLPKVGDGFWWVTTQMTPELDTRSAVAHTLEWFNRHIVAWHPVIRPEPPR